MHLTSSLSPRPRRNFYHLPRRSGSPLTSHLPHRQSRLITQADGDLVLICTRRVVFKFEVIIETSLIDGDLVPRVTYSHPEVASVGLTEKAAEQKYGAVTSVVYDLGGNGKSRILSTAGGVKVIRARDDGPVVGVHLVGDRVGELIGEAQLAVAWEALPSEVGSFVHAHPTQNEALGEAMMALSGRPLHAHS